MAHSIEDEKKPIDLSDPELIQLWRNMGIGQDFARLFRLEEGSEPEVGNAFEERYALVCEELKVRNLL